MQDDGSLFQTSSLTVTSITELKEVLPKEGGGKAMRDYSLASVHIRLARPGEELVVHRFNTGALGLAPIDAITKQHDQNRAVSFWSRFKKFCDVPYNPSSPDQGVWAACVPPGTWLQLRDISAKFQRKYGCAGVEEVVFTQAILEPFTFRDAILFGNGALVLFQRLKEGQRVRVLSLSSTENIEPIPPKRVFSP